MTLKTILAKSAAAAAMVATLAVTPVSAASPEANIEVIKSFFGAYGTGDMNKVTEFFAEDIVWRIPGRHPLSGEKKGKAEVSAFFQQLAKAGFKAEPMFFGANESYVVDVHRGWSNIDGAQNVDTTWALVFKIENGKIKEATNLSADQDNANAFFWSAYKLKAIPDRLAE
jgi:uncharacterized protein